MTAVKNLFLLFCLHFLKSNIFAQPIPSQETEHLKEYNLEWPQQWNATLAKVNPKNNWIWWTKFYYDWTLRSNRFDFFSGYVGMNDQWQLNCSILFTPKNQVWFNFPKVKKCYLDHNDVPTLSPNWIQNATFLEDIVFRGMNAKKFTFAGIEYIVRESQLNYGPQMLPLRSTNQVNDPGATDYFDIVLGPQNPTLFEVPSYCEETPPKLACPPF